MASWRIRPPTPHMIHRICSAAGHPGFLCCRGSLVWSCHLNPHAIYDNGLELPSQPTTLMVWSCHLNPSWLELAMHHSLPRTILLARPQTCGHTFTKLYWRGLPLQFVVKQGPGLGLRRMIVLERHAPAITFSSQHLEQRASERAGQCAPPG